jgi:hypothetical protein
VIVFTRHDLVACAKAELRSAQPALLLEGDWPGEKGAGFHSLDESIDARHGWIDVAATELAERLAHSVSGCRLQSDSTDISLAWINVLALRYYFAKLLRPVAFFAETMAGQSASRIVLHAARHRDEDYADVLGQLCLRRGLHFAVQWHLGHPPTPPQFAPNAPWRRLASWLNARLLHSTSSSTRILLCGNPRILDPVCRELLNRRQQVAWLYDRFPFAASARWQWRGVRLFTCDADRGQRDGFSPPRLAPLVCRGIDLATPAAIWLQRTRGQRGARQTRLVEEAGRHIEAWQPTAVIVDEDATPLPRIVLWHARQMGATSFVVQHGAPRVRFGFAPLAADRFLAWGQSSAEQLCGWGVPRERIEITGSPQRTPAPGRLNRSRADSIRILLFATTSPADDRPDAVEYHFTARTHDDCLRMAFAVAARHRAELIIKLHPRCRDQSPVERLVAEFPELHCRIVRGTPQHWLQRSDVVLNCGSSAGIEAAHGGWPVIELLPAGSRDLTPADQWGLFGSARNVEELLALLERALLARDSCHMRSADRVFIRTGEQAASAIADAILDVQTPAAPAERLFAQQGAS